jgi:GH15 family glucan-1,4-alpha-glucosidase
VAKRATEQRQPSSPDGSLTQPAPSPFPFPTTGGQFPPIGDYGFLSDCHTAALVASDGAVEWLCLPHFDSPSVFAAILDRAGGTFRVGPYGTYVPNARRYLPGTNVLETTWMTSQGWLVVTDCLAMCEWDDQKVGFSHTRPPTDYDAAHVLVRMMECVEGQVQVELVCEPALDYGRQEAVWTAVERNNLSCHALDCANANPNFRLFSSLRMGVEGNRVHARHTMRKGERCFCALSWAAERSGPQTVEEAVAMIETTTHFWREWLAEGNYPDHPLRSHLERSALTLKGLTFMPTGALVAAATTSLPETIGGSRNWDYRYCWMRDATFTLWALHALGLDWEADDFIQYLADLERNEDGSLQIMYGIRGERDLEEQTLDHLKGYANSRPVRIGNAAYKQRQNDVYGAVLDSVYVHSKRRDHIPERVWPLLKDQVECSTKVWHQPDQGIWEARGAPRHYVSSKLMCWVACDRGARLAERRGEAELAVRWQEVADEIRADLLEKGVSPRGVFRQHYETDALDASTLLVPLVRFLPPTDERVRNTVRAIQEELTENGLVLRYRPEETDDGQEGKEGTFLICSFWLVSALAEIGEGEAAQALLERLLSYASPLGLYAEELDSSSGRMLGNFPQAFTHLALINAVRHVVDL